MIFEIYNIGIIYRDSQKLKLELKDIKYQTAENLGLIIFLLLHLLFSSVLEEFYKNEEEMENMTIPQRKELSAAFENKSKFYKINILSINDIYLYVSCFRPKFGPEEIKVFHTKIYAIISNSYLKNHALLVDSKVMIGVPYFHLEISDNFFTLIEILKSLEMLKEEFERFLKEEKMRKNMNNPPNSNSTGRESQKPANKWAATSSYLFEKNYSRNLGSKSKVSKEDAILLEELNFLLRDHLKEGQEKKNCKHCIIKFKKSSVIFNLIFGNFWDFFKDFHKTDFFLLERLIKKQMIMIEPNDEYGIFIDFFSSQRLKKQIYNNLNPDDNGDKKYLVSLKWPFLLVTVDTGFFKNNMTIHCSKADLTKSKKKNSSSEEEEYKSPHNKMAPESNLNSPDKKKLLTKENMFKMKEDELSWDRIKSKTIDQEVTLIKFIKIIFNFF